MIHARRVMGLNTKRLITKEDFNNAYDKFSLTKKSNENNTYKMLYS